MTDRVDMREFVGGFVIESNELLAIARAALLEIESAHKESAIRPRAVRELFRALHTIKGLAGMIGIEPIVEIAHAVETLVRGADRAGGRLRRSAVDACLNGVRAIEERVRAVADHRAPAAAPDDLLDAIAAEDASGEPAGPMPPLAPLWDDRLSSSEKSHLFHALRAGSHAFTIEFIPSDDKAARGMTIAAIRARLGELGEIVKVAPRALVGGVAFDILLISTADPAALALDGEITRVDSITPPPEVLASPPIEDEVEPSLQRAVVRVELARLDDLQDQLSALVVSRFRLEREIARIAATGEPVRTLREIADVQARQLRDLRRAILRARLVRLTEVLEPLSLIARTASRSGNGEVKLELDTAGSELDKAVADRLLPAIVHLVRNAIDHGLESPAERTAAGKPATGTVRLVGRELPGARLSISICDDGRGIDRAVIEKRVGRPLDDEQLLDVLTTPGFSTRDVATRTSGRGVGMDVVKRITTNLGGTLTMTTVLGESTTFTMAVPLTIALVDGLAFECGRQTFVAPVAAIEEIFELGDTVAPAALGTRNAATLIERRGRVVSVVSLGALLAIDAGTGARKALLVRRAGDLLAFAIDRTIGRYEVVVRPIIDPLVCAPGISGATDLGDGRPTLVLDLNELGATLSAPGAA